MNPLLSISLEIELQRVYDEYKFRTDEIIEFASSIEDFMNIAKAIYNDKPIYALIDIDTKEKVNIGYEEWTEAFRTNKYEEIISKQLFTSICSSFEEFMISTLLALYYSNPDKIIGNDKQSKEQQVVTYNELISYNSIEELFRDLIVDKVRKFTYKSIEATINKIRNVFYSDFSLEETLMNEIVDIYLIRNVIVHNKGIVNDEFLSKVRFRERGYEINKVVKLSFRSVFGNKGDIISIFDKVACEIFEFLIAKSDLINSKITLV